VDFDAPTPARLRSFSPVFPVRDLRRALAHYASLGFGVAPYADGDGYGYAASATLPTNCGKDRTSIRTAT